MQVKLLRSPQRELHWDSAIAGLERALLRAGMGTLTNEPNTLVIYAAKVFGRSRLIRRVANLSHTAYFTPLMGLTERRLFPTGFFSESIVLCFDCWPGDYHRWLSFFSRCRVRLAFFTASRSAEHFEEIADMDAIWLPEATDPGNYQPERPLRERSIDVLELGRRDEEIHARLLAGLSDNGVRHLYARPDPGARKYKHGIVFPTSEALAEGLGDTKVALTFPASRTHPALAQGVSTVTHRYFELMASKCVLLGECPPELERLFGYLPVIDIDRESPAEQVRALLDDMSPLQELVDRNYERLLEVATWDIRAAALIGALESRGFWL
jgi:hypothetical protein